MEDGFEFRFDRKFITIFSAPNYMGEFDNCGAILQFDKDLRAKIHTFDPNDNRKKR